MTQGDGGGSNKVDCENYPQYCNGETPKTTDELLDMRIRPGDNDRDGLPDEPDPTFPPVNIPESHLNCDETTYVECFYARELLNIDGVLMIDQAQFNQLLLALYYDIHQRLAVTPFMQVGYDTPFYDAGGAAPGIVCFNGDQCYQRPEVNYVAQGMLARAQGLTELGGGVIVYGWKGANWALRLPSRGNIPGSYPRPTPSDGTLYWYIQGYNTYGVLYNSIDPTLLHIREQTRRQK